MGSKRQYVLIGSFYFLGAYEMGAKVCQETKKDLFSAQDHLFRVKDNLLDQIGCGGNSNCTKILIHSVGQSLLRHAPR